MSVQLNISQAKSAKLVRHQVEHKKRTSLSISNNVLFCLYKHTNKYIFDNYLMISEDFSKVVQGHTNVSEHFPKMFGDNRRFPKIDEDF